MFQGGGFGTGSPSSFGSFNKPTTTFGASPTVFGSTGNSLFGSTTQPATGGLFGSTNPTPAFGQPQTTTPSFGAFNSNAGTGLFGNNQNTSTSSGLFGSTNSSAFGQAKPAFGGFGTTQTPSLFGQQTTAQTQPQTSNIFGQAATPGTTGLFGSAGGFGSTIGGGAQTGTGTVKFVAVTGTDAMVKNGVSQTISTRHHCITCMKEYESKSLEELRMEDYAANRKGPQQGVQPSGGLFGSTPQPSLFGAGTSTANTTGTGLFGATENKSLFGSANTTIGFGQSTNVFGNTGNSLFGKPAAATPAFGTPTTTSTNTFGFNSTTNTNPFGSSNINQVKPFGATQNNLFGAPTTQGTATGFGAQPSTFGNAFGTPSTQVSTGLFSQKPAFGNATTPFSFGQSTTNAGTSSLFGAKPANTFGTPFGTTPATTNNTFGTNTTFGTNNQNTPLFGNAFKPATNNFSFGPAATTNPSLGGSSSLFGNNANKTNTLFGGSTSGGGLFGSSGFGANTNTTFGSPSNSGLGMNMPMGSLLGGSTFGSSASTQPAANPLNQHILALASMPYGDNPLFKELLPSTGKVEELLKPAPTATQKNLLNGNSFKVSSNNPVKIKMKPIGAATLPKMSLFDGLDDDPSYFQKMQMKPTIKRLNLQNRSGRSPGSPRSPEYPLNPLLPLENLTSEKHSPRYFTPLEALMGDKDGAGTSADKDKQKSPESEKTPQTTPKEPPKTDGGEGSNTVLMTTLPQTPENTMTEFGNKQASTPSVNTSAENKENLEQSSSSTSSESDLYEVGGSDEPHPTGIVLRRVGYYTIPSMDNLASLVDAEGHCYVDNFTIGRYNYGNIFFPESFDVSGLNIDEIVHFRHKEVTVYTDESNKPSLGEGLNRPAQVTLDRVWPYNKKTKEIISVPHELEEMDFEGTLRNVCTKMGARFKEYRPQTGSWVFKVDHFSKYGLSDSDEEEPPVSDIKKLRLNTAPPQTFPPGPKEMGLKRGLDGAWAPPPQAAAATSLLALDEDDQDMDDELIKTPFDLDENYQPTQLSPTMQLARQMGASSRKVQLMKASFYTEDMDEYQMNGDLLDYRAAREFDADEYDQAPKLAKSFPLFRTQFNKFDETPPQMTFQPVDVEVERSSAFPTEQMPIAPPVPPVKPQHKTLQCKEHGVVSYRLSTAAREDVMARCAMDLSLFKARSYRVGWGRDATLVSLTTEKVTLNQTLEELLVVPLDQLDKVLAGRQDNDFSPAIVQRIRLLPGRTDQPTLSFQTSVEEHLETALQHSLWSDVGAAAGEQEACPRAAPRAGVEALHAHCSLAQHAALAHSHPFLLTSCQVWELCVALWGNLADLDNHEPPTSHHSVMSRRLAVSDWLENVVRERLRSDLKHNTRSPHNVFTLLTGRSILEACNQALDIGDHYASLLLAQLSGAGGVRTMLEQQLTQWVDTEADRLIDSDRLKLMMLVAGRPLLHTSNNTINVCEDLDWRRAFAIHLWYICSPVASVTDALLRYEAAFSDDDQPYASPPFPAYLGDLQWESSSGRPIHDVCYHLLKLFSSRSYPLAPLLNPATHTVDPLDHRLSWLLLRTMEALGYSHVSPLCAANIHTAFATQLEAHGLWYWAVFALQHIANPSARARAVLDMLGRHISLSTEPHIEAFLIDKLHVPAQWVYQAKATFASTHFKHREAAEYLLKAEQWNEAHKVIIQHIFAKAIINEKYDYLSGLLRQVSAHSKLVSGWGHQGALLLDYLSVVREVNNLVSQQDPSVGYHLEKLQPQLTTLCSRIHLLPTPTSVHRLAQVEIAKRAVHLIRTLLILQQGESSQSLGMSVSVLAHLVNQLPLPEDYNKQELHELTASMVLTLAR